MIDKKKRIASREMTIFVRKNLLQIAYIEKVLALPLKISLTMKLQTR